MAALTRIQRILVIALLLQLALTAAVFWPRGSTAVAVGPLLTLETADVASVTLEDDSDNVLTLARRGERWFLPEADEFDARAADVNALLESLAEIDTSRLVAQTEGSHARLGVADDDFDRRVTLTPVGDAAESVTLYVGSSATAGTVNVRLAGSDTVYLTSALNLFEIGTAASSWVDTTYVTLNTADVFALRVVNGNGTFTFEKLAATGGEESADATPPADSWIWLEQPADATLDEAQVTSLLNRLANLRLTAPLSRVRQPAYGVDSPAARVTVQTADETFELVVGAPLADGFVAKWSAAPFYVTIAEFSAQSFIELAADTLIVAAEAPAP